jgi:hypothetical protein
MVQLIGCFSHLGFVSAFVIAPQWTGVGKSYGVQDFAKVKGWGVVVVSFVLGVALIKKCATRR